MARFDRTVPPGGSGKIVLSLDSTKVQGPFTKTATVTSNDPERPALRLAIKGVVRKHVEVSPERLFLKGFREDRPKASVKITSNLETPLRIKEVKPLGLARKVAWELKTLQEGKEYEIEVVNEASVGRYNGKFVVTTDSARKPGFEIPLYADITGEVGFYPPTIELGRMSAGSKGQIGRQITLWKNRGEGFQIRNVAYDKERFEVEVSQQGPRYTVLVRPRMENLRPGEFKSEVRIETTSADLPELVVPVHGWVQ